MKRLDLIFNDKDCQVLNFSDMTAYKRLEAEKETNRLLMTLNTSVHHEMLAPLKATMEISARLVRNLKEPEQKKMA